MDQAVDPSQPEPPDAPQASPLELAGKADDQGDTSGGQKHTWLQTFARWCNPFDAPNIADELTDSELSEIGSRVVEEYEIDKMSGSKWREEAMRAMDLAMQKVTPKTYPWPNASNIVLPIITQASDQFAARAYPGVVQNNSVVKGIVAGDDSGVAVPPQAPPAGQPGMMPQPGQAALPAPPPGQGQPPQPTQWIVPPGAKAKRAERIGNHMSWQLLQDQEEWESDTDQLLHILPIMGCCFRKTFFDPTTEQNSSVFIPGTKLVVNYGAKSTTSAPRLSEEFELYPHEIFENEAAGFYRKNEYGADSKATNGNDRDAPRMFIEQHRRIDLDKDGYAEPYIVTVHKESMKVARISANWDADGMKLRNGKIVKIKPVAYYTKYDFLPNREGGFYGQGFGQLLTPINEAANATINMMLDSGHLANLGGGFIARGLSIHSGQISRKPGEWTYVNAPSGDVSKAMVPLRHDGPSTVLMSLLGVLQTSAKEISSVQDVLTGDLKAQTMSPTVFSALVEQGLKVFTAIFKRIHRALKSEYRKIFRLNRLYLRESQEFEYGGKWLTVTPDDYNKASGVAPVSDPNMVVDAQRMARTQILAQFKDDPMFDGIEIRHRILETAGISDIDKLLRKDPGVDALGQLQMAQTQLNNLHIRSKVLLDTARAINQLAQADNFAAQAHGNFQEFVSNELQQMEVIVNALGTPQGTGQPQPGQPGQPAPAVQPAGPAAT